MSMLSAGHREWASRPADERFNSMEALEEACALSREQSAETRRPLESTRIVVRETGELALAWGKRLLRMTHWSFDQLSKLVDVPAHYLRRCPSELARDNLNNGIATFEERARNRNMLVRNSSATDALILRAITTDSDESKRNYHRVWNVDLVREVRRLQSLYPQWQPAPAAYDGSRGLYASDRDLFMFLVDNDRRIFEKDPNGGFSRGFFLRNTEEGNGSLWFQCFCYSYICGNHFVWEASNVITVKTKHVGDVSERAFDLIGKQLAIESGKSAREDEARITKAQNTVLGATREEVLLTVNSLRWPELPQKVVGASYIIAEQNEDIYGNPHSVWGFVNGLTQYSRDLPFADERNKFDKVAGKVLAKFASI